jgi:hypothetical protein
MSHDSMIGSTISTRSKKSGVNEDDVIAEHMIPTTFNE